MTRTNYFLGNDPAKWHTNIPNYGEVRYRSVYPGIDLLYYGNHRKLEHDFVLAPYADPGQIVFSFSGVGSMQIDDASGDLLLETGSGQLRLKRPVSYQQLAGKRIDVATRFILLRGGDVAFSLGGYDRSQSLTIDPILVYSTYLGGNDVNQRWSGDAGNAITVGADGSAYITGVTYSTDFPVTSGSYQQANHDTQSQYGGNAFVSKLSADGTALLFSTYLGGSGALLSNGDTGNGIALDSSGNIYVVGSTNSLDFPTTSGAYQTANPNASNTFHGSGFVTKLKPDGSALLFSTYLGGAGVYYGDSASVNAVAVSSSGHAYVTGIASSNFPVTSGALASPDCTPGGVFVTEMSTDGASLVYSAAFGDLAGGEGTAIALDSVNHAYVTGQVYGDIPLTSNAYLSTDSSGGFLVELSIPGTSAVYGSYLDFAPTSMVLDHSGHVYLGGSGAPGSSGGSIEKFNSGAQWSLAFSSDVGGKGSTVSGLAVDASGNIYVGGTTIAGNLPLTPDALNTTQPAGSSALYITKISANIRTLLYSTLFGGTSDDAIHALVLGSNGNLYVTGASGSYDFPTTPGAFQTVNHIPDAGLGSNGFVSAFSLGSETTPRYVPIVEPVITSPSVGGSRGVKVNPGQPLTLTISVFSPYYNVPTPTGSIRLHGLSSNDQVVSLAPSKQPGIAVATWTSTTLAPGYYTVYATYAGDGSFTTSAAPFISVSFTVIGGPAHLYGVPGLHHQTTYGAPMIPVAAQVYDDFGDRLSGITVTFSGAGIKFSSATAVTGSDGIATTTFTTTQVGQLNIVASVGSLTLSIPTVSLKAPLYISARNVPIHYGQTPPALTAYFLEGFVNGDTAAVVSGAPVLTTSVTSTTPVGFYKIGVQTGTLSAQNYDFRDYSAGEGSVEVAKAPLHIRADSFTIHAGDPLPTFTYTLTGFVNGETQASATTGSPTLTTTAPMPTRPGRYYIIGKQGTLQAANYYFLSDGADYGILTVLR